LVLRGAFGLAALSCYYAAVVHLPLAEATVLHFTNPAFTALAAAALLGERVSWRLAAGVASSFVGVLMIARPLELLAGQASSGQLPWVGVSLSAALLSSLAYVTVRKLGETEHPLVVVFYFPLVTVPAVLPVAALSWVPPTPVEWLQLLGVGVTTQIAQVHLTRGLALEPAGEAVSVGYLQIVFAAIWGALFFRELPDGWGLAGAALVALSTLWLGRRVSGRQPPAGAQQ
jgi:drug/metabolite transporter (DMT)-like permease